jgi:hypothetical protein
MKFFSSNNRQSRSYNSLDKKWLNGHSMDNRSSSKIRSMRMMILILTGFLTFYFVIITSIGYQPKKLGSSASPASKPHSILDTLDQAKIKESEEGIKTTQTPKNTFEQNSPLYFRITGCLMLGVLIFTAVGVNRESPLMSMMSSIVCLCAVAQSVSNSMANIQISSPVFKYLIVSPAAFLGLLGVLLTIYTSLIWASEFETPPHVIEEYRWYLNQIRSEPAFTSPPQLQKPRLSGQGLFMKTHSRGNSSVASGEVTVEQHDLAASTNSYSSAKNH